MADSGSGKLDQILSVSSRPSSFSQLIGQSRTVKIIRQHYASGRSVPAWMFSGESGYGKTTIARIIALSLQCPHQQQFGDPCIECQRRRSEFDIIEINASDVSGVNEIQQVIVGSNYVPRPPSRKRVYILDEAQKLSDSAQQSLLKPFEDSPKSTVWIICTTEPGKIKRTLRRRCLTFTIQGLGIKGVEKLVAVALQSVHSQLPATPLTDALHEQNVTSPGFIVQAVEKYLAGEEPEQAAQVGSEASVNTLAICRSVIQGDWLGVRTQLESATGDDSQAIRAAVAGYLKTVLIGEGVGKKAATVSEAILLLGKGTFGDSSGMPATAATLYQVTKLFRRA